MTNKLTTYWSFFTVACCSILIAIFNSNYLVINKFIVHQTLGQFKDGIVCIEVNNASNKTTIFKFGTNINENDLCDNSLTILNETETYQELVSGSIGLGSSYFNGYWTIDRNKQDLGDLLAHLFWNIHLYPSKSIYFYQWISFTSWKQYVNQIMIPKDRNTDIIDVNKHYFDTKFYQSWLDDTMSYTCAEWNDSSDSLYDATMNKVEILIHKLNIPLNNPSTINILEVGAGWGYLSNYIHSKYMSININVTGINVASEQHNYAFNVYGNGNRQSPYYFLMDFRNLSEVYGERFFDRIISVGVISHIHIKRLDEWFETIYNVLKPGGLFVMQGIIATQTLNTFYSRNGDSRSYACSNVDYVTSYIFPGGCILAGDWITDSAIQSGFITLHREHIGQHYAKTLREWRSNLVNNETYILNNLKVPKNKFLAYEMYLAYAEASYRIGKIEKAQFVFYKPKVSNIHSNKFDVYQNEIKLGWQ